MTLGAFYGIMLGFYISMTAIWQFYNIKYYRLAKRNNLSFTDVVSAECDIRFVLWLLRRGVLRFYFNTGLRRIIFWVNSVIQLMLGVGLVVLLIYLNEINSSVLDMRW